MNKLIIVILFILTGCSTVDRMQDTSLTEGCAVVEADAKLGWMNQEGRAEVCKIKCSPTIPDTLVIEYENTRSGCNIRLNGETN